MRGFKLACVAQVREKNAAGVEELQTVHRYAPNSGTDSCFGEISLVSGAKPYGGNIIARSAGATAGVCRIRVRGKLRIWGY